MKIKRPVLRWHGGKWRLAPWIISQFPPHRYYTEAFGGAASVLIRKPRAFAEVYNDLDGEVVNLFRVLQSKKKSDELCRRLCLTPFSREEFKISYKSTKDPIEKARRTIIRSLMGFGSNAHRTKNSTGFRAFSNRSHTTPAHDWAHYPEMIRLFCERLAGVVIENRPALEIISQHDSPETLHYVDPPYVHSTRTDSGHDYNHEMEDADHVALADFLKGLEGMVIVSGYDSDLYENIYKGWKRVRSAAFADGGLKRIEVLYLNKRAEDLNRSLF